MLRPFRVRKVVDMIRNGMYQTLLASMYAMHASNGEFLAALATPLNNVVHPGETEGTLATIPAHKVAALQESIQWCREAIQEESVLGNEWGEGLSVMSINYIRELEADIQELEAELEAL